MKKHGCALGLLVILVLLGTAPTVRAEDEVRRVQGLEESVEVLIDRLGYRPHLCKQRIRPLFRPGL